MVSNNRIVVGTVLKLGCQQCGATFPHFVFSGDTDMATVGLCSASSCARDALVLFEVEAAEWRDFALGEVAAIEERLARQFPGEALRLVQLLRVESDDSAAKGMSFRDFKKVYKAPVLVYACICCVDGESRAQDEISTEKFRRAGGNIMLTGQLLLQT